MSSATVATAPLGEQIARKQSGVDLRKLVTATPSQREHKGEQPKGGRVPAGFRFSPPPLATVTPTFQDKEKVAVELAKRDDFSARIRPWMDTMVGFVRQIQAMPEDERALAQGDWDAVQSALAEALNASDNLAKQFAVTAYADAMLRTCPEGRSQVIATLNDLVKKGFATDDGPRPESAGQFRPKSGQYLIYGRLYSLADQFKKSEEAPQVFALIPVLVSRAVAAGREYFETQRAEVVALAGLPETQLTLDQLQDPTCPDGLRHLPVPRQEWNDRDGKPHFRKEGGIVVQVVRKGEGPAITMLAGYGGVAFDAEKIRAIGVFVKPSDLKHEHIQPNQRLEPAQYGAIVQLHRLIRLGIGEATEQAKRNAAKADFNAAAHAEREALAAKATLTAEEFLIGEKIGSAVVRWAPGAFEWRNRYDREKRQKLPDLRLWHLFALFERDEQGRIKVVECPPRLVEFFAGYRDFEQPGQEYSEFGRVGVVLRQAKRNLIRAAEKAVAGEEANGDSTDTADAAETTE